MLSLDVSKAYDHVDRGDLRLALLEAQVPESLVQLILLIHFHAALRVRHGGHEKVICTKRGLRQGCSLAPALWAIYSGWLLRRMDLPGTLNVAQANTTYADDMHYQWDIHNGVDLEAAYGAMKHILLSLQRAGLSVSEDKTVIILGIKGSLAQRALQRYVVDMPQGQCIKFVIDGRSTHIKLVQSHVYLGSVISYGKFEAQTFDHRLQLAKGSYSRLGSILRNRSIPLKLRLQLWQGCIWPTLLHALDCCGLPEKEMKAMMVIPVKQARSIARSHSMLTKESTVDLIKRLKLPNPVRRLQHALSRRLQQDLRLGSLIQPGEQQLQWRHLVRGHLYESRLVWGLEHAPPAPDCRVVLVQDVIHETFACDTCGQTFSTQAALRRHCYVNHLDEEQQQERDTQVSEARKQSIREHAESAATVSMSSRHGTRFSIISMRVVVLYCEPSTTKMHRASFFSK